MCAKYDVDFVQMCWNRADSKFAFAPSHPETELLCDDVSHWLGAILESALLRYSQHVEGEQMAHI